MASSKEDEFTGRRVEIKFLLPDGSQRFFPGTVQDSKRKYNVLFDDGEERSFDLEEQEDAGRLKWCDERKPKRAAKIKSEAPLIQSKEAAAVVEVKAERALLKEEVKPDPDQSHEQQGMSSASTTFHTQEGNNYVEDLDASSIEEELPTSIDAIIRYMDTIEPGANYHRLQQDSRGGCSGTRGKLRKFARKKPEHPAVRHWIETSNWAPPNKETLNAMIDLLKTMIKP